MESAPSFVVRVDQPRDALEPFTNGSRVIQTVLTLNATADGNRDAAQGIGDAKSVEVGEIISHVNRSAS